MKEEVKQQTLSIKFGLGAVFAVHAGLILSGVQSLENIGYVLAIFIVIVRIMGIAGTTIVPEADLRDSLGKVFWHWTMLFPTFAMAMEGWFAMAVIYGVTEFVFMILVDQYKKSVKEDDK